MPRKLVGTIRIFYKIEKEFLQIIFTDNEITAIFSRIKNNNPKFRNMIIPKVFLDQKEIEIPIKRVF